MFRGSEVRAGSKRGWEFVSWSILRAFDGGKIFDGQQTMLHHDLRLGLSRGKDKGDFMLKFAKA